MQIQSSFLLRLGFLLTLFLLGVTSSLAQQNGPIHGRQLKQYNPRRANYGGQSNGHGGTGDTYDGGNAYGGKSNYDDDDYYAGENDSYGGDIDHYGGDNDHYGGGNNHYGGGYNKPPPPKPSPLPHGYDGSLPSGPKYNYH